MRRPLTADVEDGLSLVTKDLRSLAHPRRNVDLELIHQAPAADQDPIAVEIGPHPATRHELAIVMLRNI